MIINFDKGNKVEFNSPKGKSIDLYLDDSKLMTKSSRLKHIRESLGRKMETLKNIHIPNGLSSSMCPGEQVPDLTPLYNYLAESFPIRTKQDETVLRNYLRYRADNGTLGMYLPPDIGIEKDVLARTVDIPWSPAEDSFLISSYLEFHMDEHVRYNLYHLDKPVKVSDRYTQIRNLAWMCLLGEHKKSLKGYFGMDDVTELIDHLDDTIDHNARILH